MRKAREPGEHWTVPPEEAGLRLDKFLAAPGRLGSRGRATTALERGKIFLNGKESALADGAHKLKTGERVRLWMDRPGSATKRTAWRAGPNELKIVHDADGIIVVDKPAGLLTVPLAHKEDADSVNDQLAAHLRSRGKKKPLVVHRIDRDTTGLVVFATDVEVQQRLKDQFRRHEAERIYLAVVYGQPSPKAGVWKDRLVWDQRSLVQKATHAKDPQGADAECSYKVVESFPEASLIEVTLVTGKRNQIRLQARLRGHTLVGEQRYTYGPDELRPIDFPRQALHAHKLGFRHPATQQQMRFESPLPGDMLRLIAELRRSR